MTRLEYLSFLDFISEKPKTLNLVENMNLPGWQPEGKARTVVHLLSIMARDTIHLISANLKVLKLKYCNLVDEHLKEMMLTNYQNLEEVSFSHNLLNGR
jgi:hypothetical protein